MRTGGSGDGHLGGCRDNTGARGVSRLPHRPKQLPSVAMDALGIVRRDRRRIIAFAARAAAVTVSVVDPVIDPRDAVIRPELGAIAVTSAEEVSGAPNELFVHHVTEPVRGCVVPSEYMPVAVICCVLPQAIDAFAGVTAMDASVGGVTVNVAEPLTPLTAA